MSGTSGQFRLRLRVRWVPARRVESIRRGRSGDAIQFPRPRGLDKDHPQCHATGRLRRTTDQSACPQLEREL